MRYLPKSPAERQEMLSAVGAESIDELFSSIPERFRLREALKLPGPLSEADGARTGVAADHLSCETTAPARSAR